MKKFLSLLLALVMTMSLVTISAGATEYKDLTDKDELGPQYEEAVAVLNKIGVITGYDDGSFRPEVELTRGAAAKIIVSLLIGPEAASNLPNNYAPYPDVPTGHTFAGVISYCKTSKIINGYSDGTFKPSGTLTGFAFTKMLLGALGYDIELEGLNGSGWTMNAATLGQAASLFDRLDFKGNEAVTRKDAALLALNTLKATCVQYSEGINVNVTGDNTNVVVSGGQVRSYKTSNQDFAKNILALRRNVNANLGSDWYTVEFAEEHFVDLRLTHDKYSPIDDDYGRPSSEWSYKKLSIGKFPLVPDFEYTTQVIHDVDTVTPAAKTRALGLSGYSVEKKDAKGAVVERANLWVNGVEQLDKNGAGVLTSVSDIANYTDNGTLVQVYVDNNGADFITDVVVVKTQLMEVKRIGSDYVALDLVDADGGLLFGYNQEPIDTKVNNVETEDDYYEFLKELKAGDYVAIVPVAVDHSDRSYDVGEAYTPETASGALTAVETYGDVNTDRNAINLTVGGTKYNIALWNKDMHEIDSDSVKVTKKDVTLHLDKYGNALLAEDVGSTSDWMVIGNYRQGIQNGILVTYANGWDIDGNEVSLNIGARAGISSGNNDVWDESALPPVGSLVYYTNDTDSNTGEWELSKAGVFNVSKVDSNGDDYTIRPSSSRLYIEQGLYNDSPAVPEDNKLPFYTNGVKFIYVTLDKGGEVDSIEIKKDPQDVSTKEILGDNAFNANIRRAEACLEVKDGKVKSDAGVEAVVIKSESSAVSINNLLYISNYHGSATKDANGNMVQGYEVAMLGAGGKLVERDKIIYSSRTGLKIGTFARYTESTHAEFQDYYTLKPFASNVADTTGDSVAVLRGFLAHTGADRAFVGANNRMVYLDNASYTQGYKIEKFNSEADHNIVDEFPEGVENLVNLRRAQWLDLTSYRTDIEAAGELKDAYKDCFDRDGEDLSKTHHRDIRVTMLFNDNPDSDEFRHVYLIVVNSVSSSYEANSAPVVSDDATVTISGGVLGTDYTTDPADLSSMKIGDSFTISLLNDATVKSTSGVKVKDNGDGSFTYTIEAKSVSITIQPADPVVDPVTVTVAGTDIEDATVTFTYADGKKVEQKGAGTVQLEKGKTVTVSVSAGYTVDVTTLDLTANATVTVTKDGEDPNPPTPGGRFEMVQDEDGNWILVWVEDPAPTAEAAEAEDALALSDVSYASPFEVGKFYNIKFAGVTGTFLVECIDYEGSFALKFPGSYSLADLKPIVDAVNAAGGIVPESVAPAEEGFASKNGVTIFAETKDGVVDFDIASAVDINTIGTGSEKYATAKGGYELFINGEKVEGTVQLKAGDKVSVAKKAGAELPTNNTVRAVMDTATGEYNLYRFGGSGALTDAEVLAAVNVVAGANKAVKVEKGVITFENGKTVPIADGKQATPDPLFVVSILGETEYMYAGEAFEVPSDVLGLINVGNDVLTTTSATTDGDFLAVSSGASALHNSMNPDTNYVYERALPLDNNALPDGLAAYYENEDGDFVTLAVDTVKNVVRGLPVKLEAKIAASAGLVANFQLNKKTVSTATFSDKGYALSDVIYVDAVLDEDGNSADGKVIFGIASGYSVSFNGEVIATEVNDGDDVKMDTTQYPDAILAIKDEKGDLTKISSGTADSLGGKTYTLQAGDATKAAKTGGVLEIVSAYEATVASTIGAFKDTEGKKGLGAGTVVLEIGTPLYIQPANLLNAFVGVADGQEAPEPELVVAPTFYKAGLWEILPEADITLDTAYKVAAQLPGYDESSAPTSLALAKDGATSVELKVKTDVALFDAEDEITAVWVTSTSDDVIGDGRTIEVAPKAGDVKATLTIGENVTYDTTNGIVVTIATSTVTRADETGRIMITVDHDGMEYSTFVDIKCAAA